MKRIILQAVLIFAAIFLFASAYAQVTETFNTRAGASQLNEVKGYLQNHCWEFHNMDVNSSGNWTPGIEGDGAMSSLPLESGQGARVITPMLDINGSMAVNFFYRFSFEVENAGYFKLYLVGFDNAIFMELDNFSLAGKQGDFNYLYSKTFSNLPSGPYKLMIEYMNSYTGLVAFDKLEINRPLIYNNGCNLPPVAVNDNIAGKANRTAEGQVRNNDYDPNGDYFTTYLIANSAHGNVEMTESGAFTFTPSPTFTGNSTTFTYQQCDNGYGPACSNIATVTITFATGMLPVKLSDFRVSVDDANDVTINWTTTYEQGSDHFEVERSFDGSHFETVGTVKAAGTSFSKKDYSFLDKLRNSVANKKDVYYRLKLVDVNSHAEVTKVLVLRLYKTIRLKC